MFVIDAHLDLAYNALRSRAVARSADAQTPDDEGTPSVGLPDLRTGGVGLICATIFCEPASRGPNGYRTAEEAHAVAAAQLDWYDAQFSADEMRLVTSPEVLSGAITPLPTILLMEGADPIRTPADVPLFHALGVRIVGLAWRQTRYAGGTRAPGPLTPAGVDLIPHLDAAGLIHDTSHLAEESFWQLLDRTAGPVIASHSNCRALVPTDRQLSDPMIRAIAGREGVIGINFLDTLLLTADQRAVRSASLADVVAHIRHMANVLGSTRHIGLGTDMDGGLGREHLPVEIRTSADLPRVVDALRAAGFSDADILGIMGENWLRFFRGALPALRT